MQLNYSHEENKALQIAQLRVPGHHASGTLVSAFTKATSIIDHGGEARFVGERVNCIDKPYMPEILCVFI